MMGHRFYNDSIRKYVSVFGTLFNDIVISRVNESGVTEKNFKVPIQYAPYQKFLTKLKQDPDLNRPVAMTYPRMSFEITNMSYDETHKLGNQGYSTGAGSTAVRYTPAPYIINFSLYIVTKYIDDGNRIVEQILPFFRPEWTSRVQFFPDNPDFIINVPLYLDNVTQEDGYEGSYEDRRIIMWTLNFTMHVQFFGPVFEKKLIKFVKTNLYATDQATASDPNVVITVQPGMDIDGNPTTDINKTIPYQDINPDDDWDYIVIVEDE